MKNQIDSKDELYFGWWCDDLMEFDIIKQYDKGQTYLLSDSIEHSYKVNLRTKVNTKTQSILNEHKYSPDYELSFTGKHIQKFICRSDSSNKWNDEPFYNNVTDLLNNHINKIIVEIKPSYDFQNMNRLFVLNQKWIFDKYGIYVNQIEVQKLFKETFTPQRYLYTDKGLAKRDITKWEIKTLKQFINA